MELKYLVKEAKYYRKVTGLSRGIKKFVFTQTYFKKFVNGRLYSYFYKKAIDKKSRKIIPFILQIENTNICNAKCIMCPHVSMKRKQRVMSQDVFEKIVDNVFQSYPIKRITLNGFGEPFCDKDVISKIEYLNKKYPDVKIDIYTNFNLVDKKLADELLNLKIDRITFSINGLKSNYKKIMELDYDKTHKNVLYFLKNNLRNKKNKTLTNVSLMILDENKEDVKSFIDFWGKYSDSVRVYPPSDWAGGVTSIIQETPFKHNKRWPCIYFFTNITVDVDGNAILCCRDYESKGMYGNLLQEDIKKIRNSPEFKKLIKRQLNQDFAMPVCNVCDIRFESSLDWMIN
ncbi:radical SAM protein [Candidatus Pacearchaeota archaeon]|nr:radical SAM protein [Candidatus Pacearchaeota archaeon]